MIIGIEGVSCVGKTTLAAALAVRLDAPLVVPCYYHSAPDPARLPPPLTATAAEQLRNLSIFLRIEDLRRARALQAVGTGRDVILDRTLDTLLAHAHAVGRLRGFDCDAAAWEMTREHTAGLPDLTLLLHADPAVIQHRAALRPGMPPIFYHPQFAAHFHEHFHQPMAPTCIPFDAGAALPELVERAWEVVQRQRNAGVARSGLDVGNGARRGDIRA